MARGKATKPAAPLAEGEEVGFLLALRKTPDDRTVHAAYADWLEEHERPYEAAVHRDRAGVSEVWYKIRRKTDGLFAHPDGSGPSNWSTTGTRWRSLKALVPHVANVSRRNLGQYLGVNRTNLEIVIIEVRPVETGTLPVAVTGDGWSRSFAVTEPVTPRLPAEETEAAQPDKPKTQRKK